MMLAEVLNRFSTRTRGREGGSKTGFPAIILMFQPARDLRCENSVPF
jgi:hypothetical protein